MTKLNKYLSINPDLVLASESKVRAEILTGLGLEFDIVKSPFDEEGLKSSLANTPPKELSLLLAEGKAAAVSGKSPEESDYYNKLVLAADQICEYSGKILSKPRNAETAFGQLRELSGKTHYQHSAACIYLAGEPVWQIVQTAELTMRDLSDEEIKAYIALDEPYSSCGGYRLERLGKHLFSFIDGGDDIIKGLPTIAMLKFLYKNDFLKLGS